MYSIWGWLRSYKGGKELKSKHINYLACANSRLGATTTTWLIKKLASPRKHTYGMTQS